MTTRHKKSGGFKKKRLYQATMNYINNSSNMIIFEKPLSQPKLKAHSHDSKSNKSSNESWRTNHHPKESRKERTIKKARPLNKVSLWAFAKGQAI